MADARFIRIHVPAPLSRRDRHPRFTTRRGNANAAKEVLDRYLHTVKLESFAWNVAVLLDSSMS